jgi:extradiol dioxygenase family protein
MRGARIQAVDHVHLDVPSGCGESLRTFYGTLLGLPVLEIRLAEDELIAFGANRLQMRLIVRERPQVHAFRRRLTLEVDSLAAQAERFAAAGTRFRSYRGFRYTEQRLFVHDPAGHLLELKQVWPF